ncbi:hypothetical protein [Paenibacillus hamazuiensis]|uniref:hypothetical protein n=1 Tax=Paenibacillus hamazuiensis TaxID=2936508 RepID=UPI0020107D2F|nr:hypothetical protein [Paenibacillus hamazuiensis]
MNLLDQYKSYRKMQFELHKKILKEIARINDLKKSAEMLGVLKNNDIVLEKEEERDSLLDFIVYETTVTGPSAFTLYAEKHPPANEEEAELYQAMKRSATALYEIEDIDVSACILKLKGMDTNQVVNVIDLGMSQTLKKGMLLFSRIVRFDEYGMTSGLVYGFSENHRVYVMSRSRKLMKKVKSGNESVDRFVAFFHLNRSDGVPRLLEKVK